MVAAQIDEVFKKIDDLCQAGDFDAIDSLIRELNVSELSITMILSWVAITKPARDRLPSWPQFREKCEERVRFLAPERAHRLLRGLR